MPTKREHENGLVGEVSVLVLYRGSTRKAVRTAPPVLGGEHVAAQADLDLTMEIDPIGEDGGVAVGMRGIAEQWSPRWHRSSSQGAGGSGRAAGLTRRSRLAIHQRWIDEFCIYGESNRSYIR